MKRITLCLLAASALLVSMTPAHAQLEHLNVDRLIKEMRERGMSDLLIRLARDGSIKNKEDADRLGIEMLIMRAQTAVPNNPNDLKERLAKLEEAIVKFQELIAAYRDSTKRPLWQADFTMVLLYTRMAMNSLADDFYEFGVPTAEQAAAFETGAGMAAEHLIDAANSLAKLSRDLPRAPDYNTTYVNTGRWEEMMDEYLKTKVPFLLGQAAYLAAQLPDSSPYFKNLGKNPNIPLQGATPDAERKRLLNLAIESLSNIPVELGTKYGLPPRPTNLVKAKAMIRLGQFADGITLLESLNQPADDLLAFRAQLAKAIAFDLKDKNPQAAIALLETLKDHPLARDGIAFPIIITDLQHKLMLKYAGTDKVRIEEAYKPYDSLFTDKRLGERTQQTRMFVYERWTKQFASQKQDALPLMVLSGMGEMERIIGNQGVAQWYELRAAGKEAESKSAMTQASVHLDKCIKICDVLIARADVSPEVKARARYNKAYASYLAAPEDSQAFLSAAAIWTELADELPKHPLAEEAIGLAVRFLHNLHASEQKPAGTDAGYLATTNVLFTKLGDTKVAEDERMYYTFHMLQTAGKYKEAVASYEKIPTYHRDYVQAQRELLFCSIELWRETPDGPEKTARRDFLRDETIRIEKIARKELADGADSAKSQLLTNTLGDLVLMRVEIDMDRKEWAEADRVLRNFADDFANQPNLIRLALSRRIMVKVKGGGSSSEAVELAQQLMKDAGDDVNRQSAAAGTIDQALGELAEEIDNLRAAADVSKGELDKAEFMKRAAQQAEASEKLADMLLDWARKNNVEQDQMNRYLMIKARSSVLTGNVKAANEALAPIAKALPNEPRIMFLQGEVLFMTGAPADLRKSHTKFTDITKFLTPKRLSPEMTPVERNTQDVYNRLWWQSWFRLLQIYDKTNTNTNQIPRLVDQLKLQHPDLGGPGMRNKFEQLGNKYRK